MEKKRIKELVIGEEMGVFAISLVENPAIEIDGIYLSADDNIQIQLKEDVEQGLFAGIILRPEKDIKRKDEQGYFYINFSSDTVKQLAHNYIANNRQAQTTEEHQKRIDGVTLVETWTVVDPKNDKINALGLAAQKGDWAGLFDVQNEDTKAKLRSGELKGISIEGSFEEKDKDSEFLKELKSLVD